MTKFNWAARANKPEQEIGVAYELRFPSFGVAHLYIQRNPGEPFELCKIDDRRALLDGMESRVRRGWFKLVKDANSPEAIAWRQVGDEEAELAEAAR